MCETAPGAFFVQLGIDPPGIPGVGGSEDETDKERRQDFFDRLSVKYDIITIIQLDK